MDQKKKLLTVLFGMIISLSMTPSSALAVDAPIPLTSGAIAIQSGSTYSINDYEQLDNLAKIVNGDGGFAPQPCFGATFILTGDIACSDTWDPIGSGIKSFGGTFDGQGHTVSGMALFSDTSTSANIGFFGHVTSSGVVKNLDVSGTLQVHGGMHSVGGVIGENDGTVQNCSSSVLLLSNSYAFFGGIVGYNNGGTVKGCINSGQINGTGTAFVGGIVGTNFQGSIVSCTNSGSLENAGTTGGIAGRSSDGEVRHCINQGPLLCTGAEAIGGITGDSIQSLIRYCANEGPVSGLTAATVGGVVGNNGGNDTTPGIIRDCFNKARVEGASMAGGIAGESHGCIQNCYNSGYVLANARVGGIVVDSLFGTIENCYNGGTLAAVSNPVSGIVATNSATVSNCYWLTSTANIGIGSGAAGTDVVSFTAFGNGTLSASVSFPRMAPTTSLLSALNYWVNDNANTVPDSMLWGLVGLVYTYPILIDSPAEWMQLAGNNRYDTMRAIVEEGFPSAAVVDTVIVATGANYPDALAAAGLAGVKDAPIILTDSSGLNAQAQAEIQRLDPDKAIVIGGSNAISTETFSQIESLVGTGRVTRVSGDNRIETALEIYAAGTGWSRTAVIASGFGFADALSISPYAFAHESPIFLTGGNNGTKDIDDATKAVLTTSNFDQVIIVGGTSVVSTATESYLKEIFNDYDENNVVRLSGDNRYQTSARIAEYALNNSNLIANKLAVATGMNFPDALAGSTLCGTNASVLLLVDDTAAGLYCANETITDNKADISQGYFLGGNNAVTPALQTKIRNACD